MLTATLLFLFCIISLAVIASVIGSRGDALASPQAVHAASIPFAQNPKEIDFFAKCLKNSESSGQAYTISDVEWCKGKTINYSLNLRQISAIKERSSNVSQP